MYQPYEARMLTKEVMENYMIALREDEKSSATVSKYIHDLNMVATYFDGAQWLFEAYGVE